uniref:Uncharacterized protein n=1 Tax=Anolis carolinensis TaxID=28377 RepID=A0A803TYI2_ANOCA
ITKKNIGRCLILSLIQYKMFGSFKAVFISAFPLTEVHVCLPSQFKCTNTNRCIPGIFRCNGQDNCGDGEDEKDCRKSSEVTCAPNQFQCAITKRCIPRVWVCDRDNDCVDGSDEPANCSKKLHLCGLDEFRCKDSGRCIPARWKCDGEDDCGDGSDEPKEECGKLIVQLNGLVEPTCQEWLSWPVFYRLLPERICSGGKLPLPSIKAVVINLWVPRCFGLQLPEIPASLAAIRIPGS